jgi:hypothetical protein
MMRSSFLKINLPIKQKFNSHRPTFYCHKKVFFAIVLSANLAGRDVSSYPAQLDAGIDEIILSGIMRLT